MVAGKRLESDLLSLEQVADELGLHVRTVRRYARVGRLQAVRIGKQYRVARAAVDALTGRTAAPAAIVAAPIASRHVEASSIVHVDDIDQELSSRITRALMSAVHGQSDEADPVRIDTVYDPVRARLKIILSGSLTTTASLLKFVNAYLET